VNLVQLKGDLEVLNVKTNELSKINCKKVGHGSDNDVNLITASCKRRREDAAVECFTFSSPSKQPTLTNLFTVSGTPFILSNKNAVEIASVKSVLPSVVGKNTNNQHNSVSFTPNVGSKS
jgi:hypothetical protein